MKEIWHVKRLGSMIYLKFTRELQKIKSKSCAHEIKTSCVLCSRCDPYACICFIYVSQFLSVYITSTSVISVRSQFKTVLKFPAEVQIDPFSLAVEYEFSNESLSKLVLDSQNQSHFALWASFLTTRDFTFPRYFNTG